MDLPIFVEAEKEEEKDLEVTFINISQVQIDLQAEIDQHKRDFAANGGKIDKVEIGITADCMSWASGTQAAKARKSGGKKTAGKVTNK